MKQRYYRINGQYVPEDRIPKWGRNKLRAMVYEARAQLIAEKP